MLTCLVLGMGIPTIPNYIITSSLAAPGAAQAGRAADRVAHVCLLFRHHGRPDAAGGAGRFCCGAHRTRVGLKIGMQALRVAIAGFIVPYMAVYSPALMLQGALGWPRPMWCSKRWWPLACGARGHWLSVRR
jgi:TRAP-type uncharacterized transport system fused permease subunit